jgi:hypothetical protein
MQVRRQVRGIVSGGTAADESRRGRRIVSTGVTDWRLWGSQPGTTSIRGLRRPCFGVLRGIAAVESGEGVGTAIAWARPAEPEGGVRGTPAVRAAVVSEPALGWFAVPFGAVSRR